MVLGQVPCSSSLWPAALLFTSEFVPTAEGEDAVNVGPPVELLAVDCVPAWFPLRSRKEGVTPEPVVGAVPNRSKE